MNHYAEDDIYEDVMFWNEEYLGKKRQSKKARALVKKYQEEAEWTLERQRQIEEDIETIFENFIETRIIDHTFSGMRTVISKEEFIESIAGKDSLVKIDIGLNFRSRKQFPEESYNINKGPLKWLFSPRYVRESFEKVYKQNDNI